MTAQICPGASAQKNQMRRFSIFSVRYGNDCKGRSVRDNPFTLRVTTMKEHLCGIVPVILILLFLVVPVSAATGNWTEVNGSAEFSKRWQHTSVVFDDSLWVIGGFLEGSGGSPDLFFNDTWYSSDGNRWYLANVSGEFPARAEQSSVVYNGRIWVIGGTDSARVRNDTWSSPDGKVWTLVNQSPQFPARKFHSSVVFDNKMWVIGGSDSNGEYLNDTWYSSDGNRWYLANASAEFPARLSHTSLVYDNKIWIIGGMNATSDLVNDVWYSPDGSRWFPANLSAGFSPRNYHTSVVYDNRMWVIGGQATEDGGATYVTEDDAWYSSDGIIWLKAAPVIAAPKRECHTTLASGSKIWMLGGYDGTNFHNSTWSFQSSPVAGFSADTTSGTYPLTVAFTDTSSGYPVSYSWVFGDGGTSTSQNPVHTFASAGTYSVSLTVTNSDGTGTETKANYIRVTAPPVVNGGDDPPQSAKTEQRAPLEMTVNVGGSSAVSLVTVTGTGLSGLIVTGTVVNNPGPRLPPVPGIAYQYLELVPARYLTIDGAEIFFAVPGSWLIEHGLEPEDIVLYRATENAWQALPTRVAEVKNGEILFSAESNGFSLFAIAGTPRGRVTQSAPEMTNPPTKDADAMTPSSRTPEQPAPVRTTVPVAVHPDIPESSSPVVLVIAGIAGCCGIVGAGVVVRRWWLRRQNPALFRK